MKHRKLRIAWSVAWGVVAMLLVALWVRSYWWIDHVILSGVAEVHIASSNGMMLVKELDDFSKVMMLTDGPIQSTSIASIEERGRQSSFLDSSQLVDDSVLEEDSILQVDGILIPIWLPALIIGFCATFPWLRFSLRTLLIVTTLIAVVLGIIVWMSRGCRCPGKCSAMTTTPNRTLSRRTRGATH